MSQPRSASASGARADASSIATVLRGRRVGDPRIGVVPNKGAGRLTQTFGSSLSSVFHHSKAISRMYVCC
jgi:hypothetical protein